jgi:hypothetical protein
MVELDKSRRELIQLLSAVAALGNATAIPNEVIKDTKEKLSSELMIDEDELDVVNSTTVTKNGKKIP